MPGPPAGRARLEGGRFRFLRSSLNQSRKEEKRLPRERGLPSDGDSLVLTGEAEEVEAAGSCMLVELVIEGDQAP